MNVVPSGTTEFQGTRPSVNCFACCLADSKVTNVLTPTLPLICSSLIKNSEALVLYYPILKRVIYKRESNAPKEEGGGEANIVISIEM